MKSTLYCISIPCRHLRHPPKWGNGKFMFKKGNIPRMRSTFYLTSHFCKYFAVFYLSLRFVPPSLYLSFFYFLFNIFPIFLPLHIIYLYHPPKIYTYLRIICLPPTFPEGNDYEIRLRLIRVRQSKKRCIYNTYKFHGAFMVV